MERICHLPRRDGPLPVDAKYVGRPSRWGNPWRVFAEPGGYLIVGPSSFITCVPTKALAHEVAVEGYREWITAAVRPEAAKARASLHLLSDATALACACPLHLACRVDVLIELLTNLARSGPHQQTGH